MKRKKYYYLDPVIIRIPGIKTLFEKSVGKRDARQNQVCSNGEVHTTPFIDAKVKILLEGKPMLPIRKSYTR